MADLSHFGPDLQSVSGQDFKDAQDKLMNLINPCSRCSKLTEGSLCQSCRETLESATPTVCIGCGAGAPRISPHHSPICEQCFSVLPLGPRDGKEIAPMTRIRLRFDHALTVLTNIARQRGVLFSSRRWTITRCGKLIEREARVRRLIHNLIDDLMAESMIYDPSCRSALPQSGPERDTPEHSAESGTRQSVWNHS